ncbi:FtsW/RodA/SpoVE family cell cycle protein [Deinococcus sp.]|uniref:FtsW/RodA/SpoVE family cell cycle protein n=1 Tax=Deinococcus sp. TaxID=47478 RepID=UPI0025BA92B3|nr:FtsW/RodA/SpoVE family cell cycle protein [Deinococcus sp.]
MSVQLIIAQLLLMSLGLLGIATTEPDKILDHGGKVLIAIAVTLTLARLRPRAFLRLGPPVWGFTLLLLVLVPFIGVGTAESEGTRRWLEFGPVRFQPSEMGKLGLVLMLSSFFARRGVHKKLISATGMIVLTTFLVLIEPDLGTSVLTFGLGIILMYAAGVRISNISGLVLAITMMTLPLIGTYLERNPYILPRLASHRNSDQIRKIGLDQIGMAHRDLNFGGLWGQGPDGLRFNYFGEHTDMIVASVGFTSGLLGVAMLLFAYWLIVATALEVAQLASRVRPMSPEIHGASTLAIGAMFMIVGQAFVNLCVAAGIFPVTGVPLPLVSYGFSSMLTMSLALAIIHSAMREVRRQLPEESREALAPSAE